MALNRQMLRTSGGTAGHLSGSDRAARCPTGKVPAAGVTSRPAGPPRCQPPPNGCSRPVPAAYSTTFGGDRRSACCALACLASPPNSRPRITSPMYRTGRAAAAAKQILGNRESPFHLKHRANRKSRCRQLLQDRFYAVYDVHQAILPTAAAVTR
jgi:hypothetical protein